MKRRDLLEHLLQSGCRFVREGGNHSIWRNPKNNRRSAIPRYREIAEFTVSKICKQLEIPIP
jgi:predicted RNA binding protein YcfA (HicA-like mRNA interferase family)